MRKNFYLSGLFLCILALCICGCGGGSAADPMGTGTVRFLDKSGSITDTAEVVPNGTITLTAKVSNLRSNGTSVPVVNEQVSFSIVNPGSLATLTVVNDRTNGDGLVTASFTSGNTMYADIVRVTTEVGATATIHINKTGGLTDPRIEKLEASAKEVVAGQTSVITAHVIDGASNPVKNAFVRFRLTANGSGAIFTDASTDGNCYVYTDVGGNATAVYKAGGADPYSVVYDAVQADLQDYASSAAVDIKRTAGTAPPPTTDLSVTLAAAPAADTEISAGQTRIITATVAGDNKAGAAVTFTIPVNTSGAVFINSGGFAVNTITVTASGTGIATVIYRAGANSPGAAIQDTVQALLANGSNAAIILKRASTTPSTYTVTITPSVTQVSAGQVSIITAKVQKTDATGALIAAPVETVSFSLPVNSSGATLTPTTATTDSSGNAVVIYQPGNASPAVTVQDTVQAAVGTATDAKAITRVGSSTAAFSISVTAAPSAVGAGAGNSSVITANVKNNETPGKPVSGVAVSFVQTGGTSILPGGAITDGSGNAQTIFTSAAGLAGTQAGVVTASITISGNTYTAAVVITH
ncbi:MAG: hypothetical protein NTW71_10440 [Deltaproteobacteria bacterium]|nr:hypothetical protein [Deltaproteobacteria bacterium]